MYVDTALSLVLRDNVIHVTVSDAYPADDNRYPRITPKFVNADGTYDYVQEADPKVVGKWKSQIGTFLRNKLQVCPKSKHEIFTLDDFPEGYRLFTHHSYKKENSKPRVDHYLYGSRLVKVFRSPQEFAFHLEWLALFDPHSQRPSLPCECKYCDPNAKQSELSAKWFKYVPRRKNSFDGTDDVKRDEEQRNSQQLEPTWNRRSYAGVGGAIWRG